MADSDNQNKPYDVNGRDANSLPFEKQSSSELPVKESLSERVSNKLAILKKVREIKPGEWLLTQEILQEIDATQIVKGTGEKKLTLAKSIELLKEEIELRYKEDEEVKNLLIDSIPSPTRISHWRKLEGWEEAVWSKLRNSSMFNNENRYKVMDAMLKQALDGDVQAAKIWLTLSGDYADKMDFNTDKRLETYREINQILHTKKTE